MGHEAIIVTWLFVGIFLLIVEIFTPTFFICCFGFGCLAAALVGYIFKLDTWPQLFAFFITTLVTFLLIRPTANKIHAKESKITFGEKKWIGVKGPVLEQIGPGQSPGRVRIGSENWKAFSEDGSIHFPGEEIIVVKSESVTLIVKSAN